MDDFLKKWKENRRFRTKIKLISYTLFVLIVAIYAFSLDTGTYSSNLSEKINNNNNTKEKQDNKNIIKIPEEYNYTITINIDDKVYKYIGRKTKERETIQKQIDNKITNYVHQNEQYYIEDMNNIDNYIITNREEVYDVINYNYINLNTINEYLNNSTKDGNQYIVYLKDILLGNESDNYIVIDLNNNIIIIDYTVLMKEFNKSISKYTVNIQIDEITKENNDIKE